MVRHDQHDGLEPPSKYSNVPDILSKFIESERCVLKSLPNACRLCDSIHGGCK